MTPADQQLVADAIERAWDLAERGIDRAAALSFAHARTMVVDLAEAGRPARLVAEQTTALRREREGYRSRIAAKRSADRSLIILADSLGLPRPDDKDGAEQGAERTYPMLLLDRVPTHAIDSYCQRYFTTRDILDLVLGEQKLGSGADVVLHVGLNDCANRMFLELERLALDLLPPELKERIVTFAQRYRRVLLAELPSHHYVPPAEFAANLAALMEVLRSRDVRRIVVATIILPVIRHWPATPGLQRNFGHYNQMLMDAAAAEPRAVLCDLDRHIRAHQHEGVLLPDGMHLSQPGHEMFADEIASLLA